ncbi:MAG TPA: carbohydrate binding domain-containing protein, partial [Dehalococcoidia bacterium]|nr:carbohydrate binding domain-containing protein [Dehalococcoidia bacterium]
LKYSSAPSNTTGWIVIGTSLARDTVTTRDGASYKAVSSGVNGLLCSGATYVPRVAAGHQYTLSFWVNTETASRNILPAMVWKPNSDGSGTTISTTTSTVAMSVGAWKYIALTGTAPAGALSAVLTLYVSGVATYYVDEIQFEAGEFATPHIATDGATKTRVATRHG